MRGRVGRHLETVVVAVIASAVTAAAPTIAASFDAANADKVDGRDAVAAGTPIEERVGKLVATNGKGYLPRSIIRKALDSDAIDGLDSSAFLQACGTGALHGYGVVDGAPDFPPEYAKLTGAHFSCHDPEGHVRAKRLSEGRYRVHFGVEVPGAVPCHNPVVVGTVMGDEDDFLTYTPFSEYDAGIDRYRCVADVTVLDRLGNRQDRDFTVALLTTFDTHIHG